MDIYTIVVCGGIVALGAFLLIYRDAIRYRSIYMVAVFKYVPGQPPERMRQVGWYGHLEDATRDVLDNVGDIFEYSYDMAVIEKMPSGIFAICRQVWFYRADYKTMRTRHDPTVSSVDRPEDYEGLFNFTIA